MYKKNLEKNLIFYCLYIFDVIRKKYGICRMVKFGVLHGKKILTKIAWTRVLLMHGNFTCYRITANLKQMFESMRLEHRSFTRNESKTSLL